MMGKRRTLEFAVHGDESNRFRDGPGMGVDKTNVVVRCDLFRHFRGELQVKGKVRRTIEWKFILV